MPLKLAALTHTLQQDFGVQLECVPLLPSSNQRLMERGRAGLRGATLLWPLQQSAGYGRDGRPWHSAPGQALTFSLGFSAQFRAGLAGLSIAVGLALVEALDPKHSHGLQLKWPNDLYCQARKLGGILVETLWQGAQPWVVIGVGLNIAAPPALAAAAVGQAEEPYRRPPAWWQECAPECSALTCLETLAPALCQALGQFAAHGLTPFLPLWPNRDVLYQRPISLQQGAETVSGIALGINALGALRLQNAQGLHLLQAGEVAKVQW